MLLRVFWCQVGEGDSGNLTNGVQTATAGTALAPGHEVITGEPFPPSTVMIAFLPL